MHIIKSMSLQKDTIRVFPASVKMILGYFLHLAKELVATYHMS